MPSIYDLFEIVGFVVDCWFDIWVSVDDKKVFLIVFNKDIGSSQKTAVSRGKGGRGGLETFGEKRKIVVK